MPQSNGIWSQEEADNAHIFSYRIAQFIGRLFPKDKPVIDFGCGKGAYCRYLKDIGFKEVIGVDGEYYQGVEIEDFIKMDLSQPINMVTNFNVICLEVGEHIPEENLDFFLTNISSACLNYLVISWALPGQDGIGHISCRTNEWVISELNKRGFTYLERETSEIRTVSEGFVNYFKDTLMIFKK
jgi:tryptophanyl-tRNA synthetase